MKKVVSIVMITYNHEKFIKKAVESILMQETDFDFELLLANDASSDGTNKVILEILSSHPKADKITYIHREKNIGMMPNFLETLSKAKGQYIAICEGDDYWTDHKKLQKQVDFLDTHLEYTVCYHNVKELSKEGSLTDSQLNKIEDGDLDFQQLLQGNKIHTPSVMYRKIFEEIPQWLKDSPLGDYPLHLIHAKKGKVYCIAENMAVYRKEVGVWSTLSELKIAEKNVKAYQCLTESKDFSTEEKNIFFRIINSQIEKINQLQYPNYAQWKIEHEKERKNTFFLQAEEKILKKNLVQWLKFNLKYLTQKLR